MAKAIQNRAASKKMPRASASLSPAVYEILEQIAREKKVSLSWVIRIFHFPRVSRMISNRMPSELLPETLMGQLSARAKKPLRSLNRLDPNIYERESKRQRSHINAASLSFRKSLRFREHGLEVDIRSNELYVAIEVKSSIDAVFSINAPDMVTMTHSAGHVAAASGTWPLYISKSQDQKRLRDTLESSALRELLDSLVPQVRESLHFYKNAVVFYCRPSKPEEVFGWVSAMVIFARTVAFEENEVVSLPVEFEALSEVAALWAISDDEVRAQKLRSASLDDLRSLVDSVWPRLDAINRYLDLHSDEPAARLGSLAETACEAKDCLRDS